MPPKGEAAAGSSSGRNDNTNNNNKRKRVGVVWGEVGKGKVLISWVLRREAKVKGTLQVFEDDWGK